MATWDPPLIDTLSIPGAGLRRMDALMSRTNGVAAGAAGGVRPGDPSFTVSLAGTAITVSPGVAAVPWSGGGLYRASMTTAWTGTVAAADPTNPRVDLVYLRVWDGLVDGSGLAKTDIVYLAGTAAASPVAPTPTGTVIYVPLATISVPAAGGGSPSATDARPSWVAPGGISMGFTVGYYTGQYRDTGAGLQRYAAGAWGAPQFPSGVGVTGAVAATGALSGSNFQIIQPWTAPGLASGYTGNGNNNGTPQYLVVNILGTAWVFWQGGITVTYSGTSPANNGNFLAAPLPALARPTSATRRSLGAACSGSSSASLSLKIDFVNDGTVQLVNSTTITPPWVSLNGLFYPL